MADSPHIKALQNRYKQAADAVKSYLEKNRNFKLLSEGEIPSHLKYASLVWKTGIEALKREWKVYFVLSKRFPDRVPLVYVDAWQELYLQNPHVMNDGLLCSVPEIAALDSGDPVGITQYVLNQAKKILEGANLSDFGDEFSYYWNRCVTDGAKDLLLIDAVDDLEKSLSVIFCKGYVCVSSSLERLNNWATNRIGKESELSGEGFGVLIHLDAPLKPDEYPRRLSDLLALAAKDNPVVAQRIREHLAASYQKGLALLVQKEGDGVALGAVIFEGLGLAIRKDKKLIQGFRPGHVPPDILLTRAEQEIKESEVRRSRVIQVNHQRIHSRGGDGRDFSDKSVLLIGCGSLGGYIAHLLSRAGVGQITLTDNDTIEWENVGRHILGASVLGKSKALALAEQIKQDLPHLSVEGIQKDWRDALEDKPELFDNKDLIVSTTADWKCEGPLNELFAKTKMPPLFFGWLEPHAVAGHGLYIDRDGGCFQCGTDNMGMFQKQVAIFKEATIAKEPGGCAHYQNYGITALMPVASMIASEVICLLLNPPRKSFITSWISSEEHFKSVDAEISESWKEKIQKGGFARTFREPWKKSEDCPLCKAKRD